MRYVGESSSVGAVAVVLKLRFGDIQSLLGLEETIGHKLLGGARLGVRIGGARVGELDGGSGGPRSRGCR